MNEQPWPPPNAPNLIEAFKKAHDAVPEKPPETVERLTDRPQAILVPPGIASTAVPTPQQAGPPPLPPTPDQQRMARIERMRQGLKGEFSHATQREQQQGRSL